MQNTSARRMKESDQQKGLAQPPVADVAEPGQSVIELPAPQQTKPKNIDLSIAMVERTTVREYSDAPLTLADLAYLLWVTQGVKRVSDRPATLRTVPSAGSRHPFETYLLVNNVETLEPGIYKYLALDHSLVKIKSGSNLAQNVTEALADQDMVKDSAVTFLWVAVAYRSVWRYIERAYRYMHLDAGHVCQNLYLAVQAVDAGCCAIGMFDDDAINRILGLDGKERFVIYTATVGRLR